MDYNALGRRACHYRRRGRGRVYGGQTDLHNQRRYGVGKGAKGIGRAVFGQSGRVCDWEKSHRDDLVQKGG